MFYEKYLNAVTEKDSFININLDPALSNQRRKNVIPDKFSGKEYKETLLNFSSDIIEQVSEYSCSIKPNTQYFLGAYDVLGILVKKIHKEGMIAILDHKLSDIGSSNDSAIFWIKEMGFDAFTLSPFSGNVVDTVENAHSRDLGVIVLTLMSNKDAEDVMVKTIVNGQPYYMHIAKKVKESQADGCVIGLTGFVKEEYVANIQRVTGDKVVFMMQGIGPQGGEIKNIKHALNPLVSLGRSVIYSNNPKEAVKKYHDMFKPIRRKK